MRALKDDWSWSKNKQIDRVLYQSNYKRVFRKFGRKKQIVTGVQQFMQQTAYMANKT